jgi:ATP-dependent Zn protease
MPQPDPTVPVATITGPIEELLERSRYRGPAVTFADVVGHAEAKRELAIVVEQFRRQSVAERLGLTLVKGICIFGPPGSGKSMLAKGLAASIDRPVYVLPTAELEPPVVREIYEHLAGTPCVVIIDEADVVLRDRSLRQAGRLAAALCAALDGVQPAAGPITIALTAQHEMSLDESVLRAGRLTTKVTINLPGEAERRELWTRYLAVVPRCGEIDLEALVGQSESLSGADIVAVVNVALGLAMVEGLDAVTEPLLLEALGRGHHVVEREEDLTVPDNVWVRAVHEAGHVVCATLVLGADAVFEVSLGSAIRNGHIAFATGDDAAPPTRSRLVARLAIAHAGLVAEELLLPADEVSAGYSHDLEVATEIALRLVGDLGLDPSFGPLNVDALEAHQLSRGAEGMRAAFFSAVSRTALGGYRDARCLLSRNVEALRSLAEALTAAPGYALEGEELRVSIERAGLSPVGRQSGEPQGRCGDATPARRESIHP